MNKDTVVGILGAVILVAAMVGIFYYEGTQAPPSGGPGPGAGTGPFAVTWATATAQGPNLSGTTNEGDSADETAAISATNLTRVEFVLAWTDDNAQSEPDEFTVQVTAPDGRTFESTDDSGQLTVLINPVNPVPTVERTGGANEADAMAQLARTYATTNGSGTWRVTVTLNDAGDVQPAPGLPPVGPLADGGNAWTLTTRLTTFSAEVARA